MSERDAATAIEGVADRYVAAWNERDAGRRRRAVAELWSEDGTYTDPQQTVRGHEAIAAVMDGAHETFPGHVFRLTGRADAHHDVVRIGWELVPEGGGGSAVDGSDVAVVAEDGRLRNLYSFLNSSWSAPGSSG